MIAANATNKLQQPLSKLYPDAPEQAGILAMHWGQAHNDEKELFYQQQAGQHALRISALSEAVGHFRRALELLPSDNVEDRIDTLIRLGESEKYLGNYAEASEVIQEALAQATTLRDDVRIASAEYELSDVFLQQDDYKDALEHGENSLGAYRRQNHQHGIARILSNIGLIHTKLGDHNKAVELCEESLRISQQLNDVPISIKTVTRLGVANWMLGDWDNAYKYFNQGLELSQANQERRWIANAHLNLGSVAIMQGDNDTSRSHYQNCLQIVQEIGDRRLEALALDNLGYVAMRSDDLDSAQSYMKQSLPLLERLGNKGGVANTYVNMGHVAYKQENMSQAVSYFHEAIQQSLSIDAKPIILESIVGLAQVEDDLEVAAKYVGLALSHDSTTGETQEMAKELVETLKAQMPESAYVSAFAAGETADLGVVVNKILEQAS
jgi:tetratricopeptide (TPR) repeat protein